VDREASAKGLDPRLAGIKIVDCDTHVTEVPDLFTARALAKYKDKVPHVRRVNGVDRWFVGDRDWGSMGGKVIRADNNKLLGRLAFPTFEEGMPVHTIQKRGCRRWMKWVSTPKSASRIPA
jgi:hypothetical protein